MLLLEASLEHGLNKASVMTRQITNYKFNACCMNRNDKPNVTK